MSKVNKKTLKLDFSDTESDSSSKTIKEQEKQAKTKPKSSIKSGEAMHGSGERKEKNVRLKTGLSSESDEDEKVSSSNNSSSRQHRDGRVSRADEESNKLKKKHQKNSSSDSETKKTNKSSSKLKPRSRSRSSSSSKSTSTSSSERRYKPMKANVNKKQIDDFQKPQTKKVDHFSRPRDRKDSSSSTSSDSSSIAKTKSKDIEKKKAVSRSNSSSPSFSENTKKSLNKKENFELNNKLDRTNTNKDSSVLSKSSKTTETIKHTTKHRDKIKKESSSNKKKVILSSHSSSTSSSASSSPSSRSSSKSNSRTLSKSRSRSRSSSRSTETTARNNKHSDDDDSQNESPMIRVNIERKPPIDKSSWSKKKQNGLGASHRSSSLERPSSRNHNYDKDENDYGDEFQSYEKSKSKSKHKLAKNRLNETFDLMESANSSNDMTDVSPLPSPHVSNSHHRSNGKKRSNSRRGDNYDEVDEEKFDMTVFYKALNKDFSKKIESAFSTIRTPKSSSHHRTGSGSKNNNLDTSFEVNNHMDNSFIKFDTENSKRLFTKVAHEKERHRQQNQTNNPVVERPFRITSSALNRQREQQRIEKENQILLKRLLKVKPSKFLNKEEQLKDYEKNFGFGNLGASIAYSRIGTSANSSFLNSQTSFDGNRSAISTKRSNKSSANISRVSSAKSSAKSSHFNLSSLDPSELLFKRTSSASRNQRPEWNDRW